MIGIIYKFTIVAKVKFNGQTPFYIGQHWEKLSVEFFKKNSLDDVSDRYYGSGVIWNKLLRKLKKQNPNNWRYFVKREILFASESISREGLTKLEEYYIKKLKSHHSNGIGGCNIIEDVTLPPSHTDEVRRKISISHMGDKNPIHKHVYTDEERQRMRERSKKSVISDDGRRRISEYMKNRKVSDETREKLRKRMSGKNNPNFGKRGIETSQFGTHRTSEQKEFMSKRMSGKNNPMYGRPSPNKGKKMSEEQKRKISMSNKGKKRTNVLRGENHPMYGKHITQEHKMAISKAVSGRIVSPETKEKMRKAALNRYRK